MLSSGTILPTEIILVVCLWRSDWEISFKLRSRSLWNTCLED